MIYLILITVGIIAGSVFTYLYFKLSLSQNYVGRDKFDTLQSEATRLSLENATRVSKEDIAMRFVSKELHTEISTQLFSAKSMLAENVETNKQIQYRIVQLTAESEQKLTKQEIEQNYKPNEVYDVIHRRLIDAESTIENKDQRILQLSTELTELQKQEEHVMDKLKTFNEEIQSLHSLSKEQFRNLATDILDEKRKSFVESNKTEMNTILGPFQKNLSEFKEKVEATRKEDIQDLTSLKNEIASLQKLNTQLSDDAKQLALALKSDIKMQGNWGEDRLNLVLETEGLQRYVDYTKEESYRDEELETNRRPDFILRLPNEKHLIIDSKVSLTAYANYYNAISADEKDGLIRQHVNSVYAHIDRLADKNYQNLAGLNSPDYVFMFMPVESALTLALNTDPEIFNYAIRKKIVLVTPSTLIASFKIVKLLWKKESQVKNSQEIYRQAGALYDKFVTFLDHMDKIESGLNIAVKAHGEAMAGLKTGSKKGSTIIGRLETIRLLEANTNKRISGKHLSGIELLSNDDFEISEVPTLPEADKPADANQAISADTEI